MSACIIMEPRSTENQNLDANSPARRCFGFMKQHGLPGTGVVASSYKHQLCHMTLARHYANFRQREPLQSRAQHHT